MNRKEALLLALVAVILLAWSLSGLARAVDLRLDTYEDGSGKVSWCLPNPIGDCSQ